MNNTVITPIDVSKLSQDYFKGVPKEVSFKYLVQVWRVARVKSQPITALQQQCDDDESDYPPLQGISPDQAKIFFSVAAKRYVNADPFRDYIDAKRRSSQVIVTPTSVATKDKTEIVKNGYIEDYSAKDASIRQVADIISVYTTYNQKSKTIVSVFTPESCNSVRVPFLDLINLRNSLNVHELDVTFARNLIYYKLSKGKQYPYYWFFCLQTILHQESMKSYRTPASANIVSWYNKQTSLKLDHRFPQYYEFSSSSLTLYKMDIEHTWIYALKSDALRGISKKRGVFSAGYYMFPMSPMYVKAISEAADILQVYARHGLQALEILEPNRLLCEVLATNGVPVKCRALSTTVAPQPDAKGIWGEIPKVPVTLYRGCGSKPVLDGKTVKMATHIPFQNNELRSCYLTSNLPYCAIYPSMRPADGIVMVYYNLTMAKPSKKEQAGFSKCLSGFIERFTRSITWRNNFLFTRVSYYWRDPHRDIFPRIVLPRLVEEEEDVLFKSPEVFDIEPALLERPPVTDDQLGAIAQLKVKSAPVIAPQLSNEIFELLIERCGFTEKLDTMDLDTMAECHQLLYQAIRNSPNTRKGLVALVAGNIPIIRLAMIELEKKLLKDRDPNNLNILFDYHAYKKKGAQAQPSQKDIGYFSDDDIQENDENNQDEENYQDDYDNEAPPIADDEDDDMFNQKVNVNVEDQE